ncbi:MAG: DUF2080 family transposase-associated protein [Candidatus Kariarchaeaceae archaeon]
MSDEKFKQKNTETLASVQFEGFEVLEKVVKSSGNSGRVYLPTSWIGTKVKIVRLTPKSDSTSDD